MDSRKFFIRYNAKGKVLESETTFTGFRPKGRGWVEVDIERLSVANVACQEEKRTFYSATYSAVGGTFAITLQKDGVDMHSVDGTTPADAVDQMNTVYAGIAVFSIDGTLGDDRIKVVFESSCDDYAVQILY